MATVYDVEPERLIKAIAEELKKCENVKPPEWAGFVKTGHFKQRPPESPDWWHIRAAAVLRKIYLLGPIGVSKLRIKFGGKKNRGAKPERTYKAAGSHLRLILQQLDKEGLIKNAEGKSHKGRITTPKGQSLLNKLSSAIAKEKPVKKEKKPRPEKKEPAEKKAPGKEAKQKQKPQKQPAEKKEQKKEGKEKKAKAKPKKAKAKAKK
ncbi:MAG TPA: 30S ribosomal protein S19e [Candidatus Woesearchaeota archaeon]|nr:30S ribosomal protein S19e [Candidatus Woesearchaeota archaeon]